MTKRIYECKSCGQKVTLFVNPSSPPSHMCKKNLDKPKLLEEITDKG